LSTPALRFAWYRFRSTFGRRWTGIVATVLLIGLLGGLAMGAVAGARRTGSSFSTYLAATNSSDLDVGVYPRGGQGVPLALSSSYYRHLTPVLAHLPHVAGFAAYPIIPALPLRPNGTPTEPNALNGDVETIGSVNGLYFDQDRVAVAQGRMADPTRSDEFVASAAAARLLHWHVGQVVPFGVYTFDQANVPGFGSAKVAVPATLRFRATLTGIVVFQSEVVRDAVDRYPTFALFTPALTRRVGPADYFPTFALRLDGGARSVAAVEREVIGIVPSGSLYNFHVTSVVQGQVQRAVKPEAIALGVFGAIAGLAALLIAGQTIGRGLQAHGGELEVLRALGAPPAMTMADGLPGTLGAALVGSLFAVVVAVGLSPLSPIGPVRQVDPSPGFAADWTVLGAGFAVLFFGLGAFAVGVAFREAPHRRAGRDRRLPSTRPAGIVAVAVRSGLPAPAVTGIRFALDRGPDRGAPPVRAALLGAVLAVTVVVATLTFASGLTTLVSHPTLYGWNWNDAIDEAGGGNLPPQTNGFLAHDPDVAAWTGFGFADVEIDGETVPILTVYSNPGVAPPILSGHWLARNDQIVLGAATLAALHKHVGDTVFLSYGSPRTAPLYIAPRLLRIVGTATLPAVGNAGVLHPSMGTGGIIRIAAAPAAFRNGKANRDPNLNGPALVVVRFRAGVGAAAGQASLQRVANETTRALADDPNAGGMFSVIGVQQPAEIVNYRSTGATPAVLALGLAVGAAVALGLTLVASVRRRRRELALLKTLGFTHRQLAATVAWHASSAAVVGVVAGVPIGIVVGRWLWTLFARAIDAVPDATVPVLQITLVAVGALVLANLVAILPGRVAARTPSSLLLQAE
jgi:hypothetical protein